MVIVEKCLLIISQITTITKDLLILFIFFAITLKIVIDFSLETFVRWFNRLEKNTLTVNII